MYSATGGALSVAAGRISHLLGLHGPSSVVDTACSSSLVALNQASLALQDRQCSVAVVAGVNLILTPWISVAYARAGMTSADGKCHTFDKAANGYCRGEGCGAVVLKRLSDAERDGDRIYAVVKGSAVMQDGKSASLTAPNGLAQEQLLRSALADAGLQPQDVSMVEAHGTGTKLGDPIEVGAIAAVYGQERDATRPLYVSSVKASIGHLEAAAGLAGIISAVAALYHKKAPPNTLLNSLNPLIEGCLDGAPIYFPTEPQSLGTGHDDRGDLGDSCNRKELLVVGVSSFGYSGTIAHVLLEEPPMGTRRDIVADLERSALKRTRSCCIQQEPCVWQFSGLGTLRLRAAEALYRHSSVFHNAMDLCDRQLEQPQRLGVKASAMLYPDLHASSDELARAEEALRETLYAEPVQVALQYCLAQEWRSRIGNPVAVMGHSLGEYVAAVVAGVMSIEDCLKMVCAQARLTHEHTACRGSMVALRATKEQALEAIARAGMSESVSLAAVNGAVSVVISGDAAAVDMALSHVGEEVPRRKLTVKHAFHSPLIQSMIEDFRAEMQSIGLHTPQLPFISTVRDCSTADVATEITTVDYWLDHLLHPVLYLQANFRCQQLKFTNILEVGADQTLTKLTQANIGCEGLQLRSSTELFDLTAGAIFDLKYRPKFFPYKAPTHRVLTHRQQEWDSGVIVLHGRVKRSLSAFSWAFAHHHRCHCRGNYEDEEEKEVLLPSGLLLEVMMGAVQQIKHGEGGSNITASSNASNLVLRDIDIMPSQRSLSPVEQQQQAATEDSFKVGCRVEHDRISVHATNQLHATCTIASSFASPSIAHNDGEALVGSVPAEHFSSGTQIFAELSKGAGLEYDTALQTLSDITLHDAGACGIISLPSDSRVSGSGYVIHPAALEAILQGCYLHSIWRRQQGRQGTSSSGKTTVSLVHIDEIVCCPPAVATAALQEYQLRQASGGGIEATMVRFSISCEEYSSAMSTYNVALFSAGGEHANPLLRCNGLQLSMAKQKLLSMSPLEADFLLLQPIWCEIESQLEQQQGQQRLSNCASKRLLLCGTQQELLVFREVLSRSARQHFAGVAIEEVDISSAEDLQLSVVASKLTGSDTVVIGDFDSTHRALGEGLSNCPIRQLLNILEAVCVVNPKVVAIGRHSPGSTDGDTTRCSSGAGLVSGTDWASNSLTGALLSAQTEFTRSRFVSVCVDASLDVVTAVREVLLQELCNGFTASLGATDGFDIEAAYGGGKRFGKRYYDIDLPNITSSIAESLVCPHAVVVTGGLGALGLKTARTLIGSLGVRKLVLVSRSGKVSYEGQGLEEDLAWLQSAESGADVHIVRCDVSDESSVVSMLEEVRSTMGGISGIVHCAGVVRDGFIRGGSARAGADQVWQSKAYSAWLLHHHTSQDDMQLFLTFSSITAAVGNPGQSVYGAANRFLDSLVMHRNGDGMAGLSVQWPAISDVGMAVALTGSSSAVSTEWSKWYLTSKHFCCALSRLLTAQVRGSILMMPVAALSTLGTHIRSQFSNVITTAAAPATTPKATAPTPRQAPHVSHEVLSRLYGVVASLLGAEEVPRGVQLMSLGLDSLGAVDLATKLSSTFDLVVPSTVVFSYPTLEELESYILTELGLADNAAAEASSSSSHIPHGYPGCGRPDDVCITGMSCRFPGDINDLPTLWDVLCRRTVVTGEVSLLRWDTDAIVAGLGATVDSKVADRIRYGGFLSDKVVSAFNPAIFGISETEAKHMDASHRLLLTVSYEALLDSGYTMESLRGKRVAVFVGASGSMGDLSSTAVAGSAVFAADLEGGGAPSVYDVTGRAMAVAAGRISFALGLMGSASTVDTACSTSLVALHNARRSLQLGECDAAVVVCEGLLSAPFSLACAVAGMTSPDGKCHTFDESANGYCRGEGCGAVVLKRLGDAENLSDGIYAVVKGSAVMQDGKSASLTAPNGLAQEQLLRSALADAGVDACDVSFLEAHGTGTKLGDPVETGAVASVYGEGRGESHPLCVSSVKANIGHLEAAAGMAGIFSAVLALYHGQAPPNANLYKLNQKVIHNTAGKNIHFPTAPTPLISAAAGCLTAAISSFGYSGTIAHMLLQEAPSANRRALPLHSCVHPAAGIPTTEVNSFVWQFAGQGTLALNAFKDMYNSEPAFQTAMASCDAVLLEQMGRKASDILYPALADSSDAVRAQAEATLNDARYSQPVLVALEYCIVSVWLARGYLPDAVMGHSLGEYAAAVVAGVMSIEDCLRLVSARARLVHEHTACRGSMVALRATKDQALEAIARAGMSESVSLAAVNGAVSVVISGASESVQRVVESFGRPVPNRKLNVEVAFHSPLLRCIIDEYAAVLETIPLSPPKIRFVSTVRSQHDSSTDQLTQTAYWIEHILHPVLFAGAVEQAVVSGGKWFLEIGADETLTKMGRSVALAMKQQAGGSDLKWRSSKVLPDLSAEFGTEHELLSATRESVAVVEIAPPRMPTVAAVTRYPLKAPPHRLLHNMQREDFSEQTVFQTVFHKSILNEWLGDYVIDGAINCPGVGLLELAYAAASKALNPSAWRKQSAGGASSGPSSMCVEGFTINRPVVVNDIRQSSGDSVVQPTSINCIVEDDGQVEICIDSLEEGRVKFAEGTVSFQQEGIDWKAIAEGVLAGRDACDQVVIGADVYRDFDSSGLRYGPTFRLLESIRYSQSTCYATLSASTIRGAELYTFSPPLMDAVLQASAVLVANYRKASSVQVDQNSAAQVPFSFNKVSVHSSVLESMDVSAQCGCFVSIQKMEPSMTVFDCSLLTATGDVAVHIEGVHVRPIAPLSDKSGVASTHAVKELSCSWVEHAQSVGGAVSVNLLEGGHKRLLLVGDASACSVVQDKLLAAAPEQQSMVIETCSVEELGRIEEAGSSADYDIVALLLLLNLDVGDSDVCGGNSVESMLRVMQTLCKRTRHLLTVLPHSSAESLSSHGGLSSCIGGVMLSAQVEFATVQMEVLACEVSADPSESMDVMSTAAVEELTSWTSELEVLLKQGKRFVKRYDSAVINVSDDEKDVQKSIIINRAGVYIITGGLGGLGLQTAKLLVRLGAKHLFLVSRSGKVPYEGQGLEEDLAWLQSAESGADVHIVRCDVSDESSVVSMLSAARSAAAGGIAGVVHCAGVLRDALIRGGGAASGCGVVWRAKALSAWWLHKHTLEDGISKFITYSSTTAAIGTIGQTAYGAANRFLDQLMERRSSSGLPSLSIRWPAVSGKGMAASSLGDQLSGADASLWSITPEQVEAVFERVLQARAGVPPVVSILPAKTIEWSSAAVQRQFEKVSYMDASSAAAGAGAGAGAGAQKGGKRKAVKGARVVSKYTADDVLRIVRQISFALVQDGLNLTDTAGLMDFGLDSLSTTELVSSLAAEFGIALPPTLVFSYPSVEDMSNYIIFVLGLESDSVEQQQSSSLGVSSTVPGSRSSSSGSIAVVGMSCRLPGDINTVDDLWTALLSGEDKISEVSLNRWDTDAIASRLDSVDSSVVDRIRYGGFLSDSVIGSFDAQFFGISEAEAKHMDPSQRLLLTASYEALVDAGLSKKDVKGHNVGVFVAIVGTVGEASFPDCSTISSEKHSGISVFDASRSAISVAAGRISYVLGLRGPCSAIDTSCASSLVALHSARRALQLGECDLAIVAACQLITPGISVALAVVGMTSADGKCHAFDEGAIGFGRGEGCGAVVLKRMDDAVANRDGIYAVVKGSAVMQDGRSVNLAAPNGLAQEQLLRSALADAGVDACDVSFLEAHGTGTILGDPVEVGAIAAVYGEGRSPSTPLQVASVKGTIGHLEPAAGMAGMFSAILAMQHRQAPPNAQLRKLNRQVESAAIDKGIVFPDNSTPVPLQCRPGGDLFTAVSSFGFSGTIAHAVLQQPPAELQKDIAAASTQAKAKLLQLLHNKSTSVLHTVNRWLQQIQREVLSDATVVSARLHRGILSDWLGACLVDGQITVPASALLEFAYSAVQAVFEQPGTLQYTATARALRSHLPMVLNQFQVIAPVLVISDVTAATAGVDAQTLTLLRCVVGDDGSIEIFSEQRGGDSEQHERILHACGTVASPPPKELSSIADAAALCDTLVAEATSTCTDKVSVITVPDSDVSAKQHPRLHACNHSSDKSRFTFQFQVGQPGQQGAWGRAWGMAGACALGGPACGVTRACSAPSKRFSMSSTLIVGHNYNLALKRLSCLRRR